MQLDFSITVTGLPIRPLSCQMSFGVNQIPVAQVGVDPTVGDVFQNIEKYRRTRCTITIKTVGSTVVFPCLFDGMSFGMSPGGVTYTAVFKGLFQVFLEIFPWFPGFSPAGTNPYIRDSLLASTSGDSASLANVASFNASINMGSVAKDNLAKTFLNAITSMVNMQSKTIYNIDSTQGTNNTLIPNILPKLTSTSNPAYAKALNVANLLTKLIDTTAVDGFTIEAAHINELNFMSNILLGNPGGSLWDVILRGLGVLGLVLVPGANKMYVVPESYFMKPNGGHPIPAQKEVIAHPNFASPGYYNNISFSDNGYQDIGGVILTANPYMSQDIGTNRPMSPLPLWNQASDAPQSFGSYPSGNNIESNKIIGAIINVPASEMASLYCTYFPANRTGVNNFNEDTSFKAPITKDSTIGEGAKNDAGNQAVSDGKKAVLDNLALQEFLKRKYMDRTGSINMRYTPAWVPGTTGTAYTRYPPPGVFIDFYVQQVTHVFDNSSGSGTAVTNISFCSGRMGQNPVGVDVNPLYGYTVAKMGAVQSAFITGLSG